MKTVWVLGQVEVDDDATDVGTITQQLYARVRDTPVALYDWSDSDAVTLLGSGDRVSSYKITDPPISLPVDPGDGKPSVVASPHSIGASRAVRARSYAKMIRDQSEAFYDSSKYDDPSATLKHGETLIQAVVEWADLYGLTPAHLTGSGSSTAYARYQDAGSVDEPRPEPVQSPTDGVAMFLGAVDQVIRAGIMVAAVLKAGPMGKTPPTPLRDDAAKQNGPCVVVPEREA